MKNEKVAKETKKEEKKVQIADLSTKSLTITLEGTSPLICHKFSERAQDKILEKQMRYENRPCLATHCPARQRLA